MVLVLLLPRKTLLRSAFFEAKVERWVNEKREVEIEDCDPEVLNIVVDYMYGIDLPSMVLMNI